MMSHQNILSRFMKLLVAMLVAVQLVACGDDGSKTTAVVGSGDSASQLASAVVLNGSVGDGPVTGATIEVWNSKGKMIGSIVSDNTASFKSTFKVKGNEYPLLLKARGGIDLVTGRAPDFHMVSVMQKPSDKQVNINPFTTLIVKTAESMPGGLNTENISAAYSIVTEKLDFGLDSNLVADLITTEITEMNVANLVKASEALGEMVRRTRDLISRAGSPVSGDAVIAALSADMTDGLLDGRGGSGTVPVIAAVANVVSGQVLVEALSNNLKVDGVVATSVMDQSIKITRSRVSPSQLTGDVRVTQGMLDRARLSLAAARVLDSSFEVMELAKTVGGVAEGSLPDDVATILPADSSRSLDNAILLASTASKADISMVNSVAAQAKSGDLGPVPGDSVPVEPVPVEPVPVEPVPVEPVPVEPVPVEPVPVEPVPVEPVPVDPVPVEPVPVDPVPVEPVPVEPVPVDPVPVDPVPVDPVPVDPVPVDPAPAAPLLGGFTLNWTAPTTRADGTPLSLADIDGYRIYFGNSPGNYSDVIEVADGTAQSANVTDLSVGTYYLVMTTYDSAGLESKYSAEISKMAH